jgi:hypothetical protein|tara:strand:- start:93 stop:458 length:366 start_codon:yes stop_codon:yes gene_type:complete
MLYHNQEISNLSRLARAMILNQLIELEETIHATEFNDLDIRSPMAQDLLNKELGIQISQIEAVEFFGTLKFELAKIIGKLENTTGIMTGMVHRNTTGSVKKAPYMVEAQMDFRRSGNMEGS